MKTLDDVRRELSKGAFESTRHALKRVVERNISNKEIREAGAQANIIEDYPSDKYSASCLLLGFTRNGRPLHIQVSLADTELLLLITIYEPDPNEWINYSQRR
jgi:uncharacterized protein DUF4258